MTVPAFLEFILNLVLLNSDQNQSQIKLILVGTTQSKSMLLKLVIITLQCDSVFCDSHVLHEFVGSKFEVLAEHLAWVKGFTCLTSFRRYFSYFMCSLYHNMTSNTSNGCTKALQTSLTQKKSFKYFKKCSCCVAYV